MTGNEASASGAGHRRASGPSSSPGIRHPRDPGDLFAHTAMSLDTIVASILALAVLVYLLYTLLRPDRF